VNQRSETKISTMLEKYEKDLLSDWMKEQMAAATLRLDLISEQELRQQSAEFLRLLRKALKVGNVSDLARPEWEDTLSMLRDLARSRAELGFTASEVATFILSFKQPFFTRLSHELSHDADVLMSEVWSGTALLDKLGLYVTEVYQRSREEIIERQRRELLELSTPVVKLWEGILALPLIGTLDSERTQVVMESLLRMIGETGSGYAIIDITGVPMVDTLVAQHLLKTVAAARLMGAECIISGIRPQIAQTIVHLGVKLTDVITRATLADAFTLVLRRMGISLGQIQPHP
jgi:rsbT co-antagonist protein RsbR